MGVGGEVGWGGDTEKREPPTLLPWAVNESSETSL